MAYDCKKLYIITALYALSLPLVLLIPQAPVRNAYLAAMAVLSAVAGILLIKKKQAPGLRRNEATLVAVLTAAIAVMAYCLSGLHFGFTQHKVTFQVFYTYVLPISVAIIATELFRNVLLAQKQKLVRVLSYFVFVLFDVLLFSEKGAFSRATSFMSFFGLVLLPALAAGLLYQRLSFKYGARAVIPYRIVMALYSHLLPFGVAMPDALFAFLKILLPLLLLWFIQKLFGERTMPVSRRRTAISMVSTVLCLAVMLSVVVFISGVFPYKSIVVASDSMKGEFDTGDALIYKDYEGQVLTPGEIIVFKKGDTTVIHRVMYAEKINGVYRYYTKGDANEGLDTGYITTVDIIGTVTMTIKYIGYPTVWLNDIFKK